MRVVLGVFLATAILFASSTALMILDFDNRESSLNETVLNKTVPPSQGTSANPSNDSASIGQSKMSDVYRETSSDLDSGNVDRNQSMNSSIRRELLGLIYEDIRAERSATESFIENIGQKIERVQWRFNENQKTTRAVKPAVVESDNAALDIDVAHLFEIEPALGGNLNFNRDPAHIALQWIQEDFFVVDKKCTCSLVVTNNGKSPATNVVVRAFFPATVRINAADPMPDNSINHLEWKLDTIAPAQGRTLRVTLTPKAIGDLICTAHVGFRETSSARFHVSDCEVPAIGTTISKETSK